MGVPFADKNNMDGIKSFLTRLASAIVLATAYILFLSLFGFNSIFAKIIMILINALLLYEILDKQQQYLWGVLLFWAHPIPLIADYGLILSLALLVLFFCFNRSKHILKAVFAIYVTACCYFISIFFTDSVHIANMLIIIAISSDIGGYIFGKLLKGPKLAEKISPNKTITGSFGSMIVALGVDHIFFHNNLFVIIIFSIICQVGDLIESYFKRTCGKKDSSNLIPGHGGIFDRIDGILFLFLCYNYMYKVFYWIRL